MNQDDDFRSAADFPRYVLTPEQQQAVARLQTAIGREETIGIRETSHPYIVLQDGEYAGRYSNFALAAEVALNEGVAWQVVDTAQQPPKTYGLTACRLRLAEEATTRRFRQVKENEDAKQERYRMSRFRNGNGGA